MVHTLLHVKEKSNCCGVLCQTVLVMFATQCWECLPNCVGNVCNTMLGVFVKLSVSLSACLSVLATPRLLATLSAARGAILEDPDGSAMLDIARVSLHPV